MMIDATTFPDVEASLIAALKAVEPDLYVSNTTPAPIPSQAVIVGFSGGGYRDWGEAAVNVGISMYATKEKDCRTLVLWVQNVLATLSNNLIESVTVPAGGGTSIPRQSPPFQRYFVVTVRLRGQTVIEDDDLDLADYLDLS